MILTSPFFFSLYRIHSYYNRNSSCQGHRYSNRERERGCERKWSCLDSQLFTFPQIVFVDQGFILPVPQPMPAKWVKKNELIDNRLLAPLAPDLILQKCGDAGYCCWKEGGERERGLKWRLYICGEENLVRYPLFCWILVAVVLKKSITRIKWALFSHHACWLYYHFSFSETTWRL